MMNELYSFLFGHHNVSKSVSFGKDLTFKENTKSKLDSEGRDSSDISRHNVFHVTTELAEMLCAFYQPSMEDLTRLIQTFRKSEEYGINLKLKDGFENDVFNYGHHCQHNNIGTT